MNDIDAPVVRRAILDLLTDVGGEINDDRLTMLLTQLGHRIARRDVRAALAWLGAQQLAAVEPLDQFTVGRVTGDGRDVAEGRLVVDGVWRHKTGR